MLKAHRGERFFSETTLTPLKVVQFADAVGDSNPIHRDSEYSSKTRFGRPIASGPHTSSMLLALTAHHYSKKGAMLGLEFSLKFKKAIYADEKIRLEWLVVRVSWSEKFQGELVELLGRVKGQDGKTCVGAKGRILLIDNL